MADTVIAQCDDCGAIVQAAIEGFVRARRPARLRRENHFGTLYAV
jgi:hypothetical protein